MFLLVWNELCKRCFLPLLGQIRFRVTVASSGQINLDPGCCPTLCTSNVNRKCDMWHTREPFSPLAPGKPWKPWDPCVAEREQLATWERKDKHFTLIYFPPRNTPSPLYLVGQEAAVLYCYRKGCWGMTEIAYSNPHLSDHKASSTSTFQTVTLSQRGLKAEPTNLKNSPWKYPLPIFMFFFLRQRSIQLGLCRQEK